MRNWTVAGALAVEPATQRSDLLADPVMRTLATIDDFDVGVAEIDPQLADTAAFCEAYSSPPAAAVNCLVVSGKRTGELRYAAALVLATTRANVKGVVRPRLDVRKVSFAPMGDVVELTGMAYGGITPVGLPEDWPILVDRAVADSPELVAGSGIRRSKLLVTGELVASLPGAEVIDLATAADSRKSPEPSGHGQHQPNSSKPRSLV